MDIGPQSAGGEEGGPYCAIAATLVNAVKIDIRTVQINEPAERLEFFMIPPITETNRLIRLVNIPRTIIHFQAL